MRHSKLRWITERLLAVLFALALSISMSMPAHAATLRINSQPNDFTAEVGDTAYFTVIATGSGLSYQWQYCNAGGSTWAASAQAGNKTNTLSVPVTQKRIGQKYRCVITDSNNNSVTSNVATILATEKLEILENPVSASAGLGQTAVFSVRASGPNLSYQWQYKNTTSSTWKNCSVATDGYNENCLYVTSYPYRDGYQYRCVVSSEDGDVVISEPATLTMSPNPVGEFKILTQPQSVTANVGENAVFQIEVQGTDISYQWQYLSPKRGYWRDSTSATLGYNTNELTVAASTVRNDYGYRCVVHDGEGNELISEAVTLTVKKVNPTVIIQQPESVSVYEDEVATFTFGASGDDLEYQWQYRRTSRASWVDCTSKTDGYNTANLRVVGTMARNGYQYRCIVSDAYGNSFTSEEATLTVSRVETLAVATQPVSADAAPGETVTFTVSATGTGLAYQWQYCNATGSVWKNSSQQGYNTDTLSVPATEARNGQKYRCVITDASGNQITTVAVTMNVFTKFEIKKHPADFAGLAGSRASFTVTAAGSGLKYQWQYSPAGSSNWSNASYDGSKTAALSLDITRSLDGHRFRCRVTDSAGEVLYSNAATLTVVAGDDEYSIVYHLNDDYLESVGVDNSANPTGYSTSSIPVNGIKLNAIQTEGYYFLGWYDGAYSNATQVKVIPQGTSGDLELYAHWQQRSYTVQFDSPINTIASKSYTVDTGLTLQNPTWFGYTFVAWTDEDEEVVTRIEKGSIGNKILKANWTSQRFQTKTKAVTEPLTEFVDEETDTYYFVYDIGTIENVPLYTITDFGNTQGLTFTSEETVTDQVSETHAQSVANAVTEATTNTSTWTLANSWNKTSGISSEHRTEASEEYVSAFERAFTSSDNYSIGTGWGLDSAYSTTDGSSAKISHSNKKSENAELSATLSAKESVSVEASAPGVKAGAEAEISASTTSKVGVSREESVGQEYAASHSDTSSTSSNWNINRGYSKSSSESSKSSTQHKIAQAVTDTERYDFSSTIGGQETSGLQTSTNNSTSRTATSSFTYGKIQTTTQKLTVSNAGAPTGYYRLVAAGTIHVFGVVGYDLATHTYFTTTYSAMDDNDEIHKFVDYSATTPNFSDNQNGVLPFEVPYYVNEKIRSIVCASDGLVVSNSGIIMAYEGTDTDVVIPQYISIDNGNDTYTAIKVTGISSDAFAGNQEIESVLFADTITEIPDSAFEGCTNLKAVYSTNVTSIGEKAFDGCTSLLGFAVPDSVTELGEDAFANTSCTIKVRAANASVADAALGSGAKNLTVSLMSFDPSEFSDRTIVIDEGTEYFELQGNGNYSNLRIESDAATTVINGITFVDIVKTPLVANSEELRLINTHILGAPGYAMMLKADTTNIALQGELTVSTNGTKAIIGKNMNFSRYKSGVWSTINVTGNVYVCGTINGRNLVTFNPDGNNWQIINIDEETYNRMISNITITFDANGGTTDITSKETENGEPVGELPLAVRTSFVFDGWYTEQNGGDLITADTVLSAGENITLYAHWISDWVKASEVPNDAEIVETKWSYTKRYYKEDSSSSLSGWTRYDSYVSGYGGTQGPVYSDPSNGVRKVWNESYVVSSNYKTVWHYYRNLSGPSGWNSYSVYVSPYHNSGYTYQEIALDYALTESSTGSYDGHQAYRAYYVSGWDCPVWYFSGTTTEWVSDNYGTRWYYQDPVYTYKYYRDEYLETTDDPTGQSDVLNVVKYVKYRA